MTGAGAGARRLANWHRFIVGIAVSVVIVGTTAVGAIAAAIAIRACRGIIAAAASWGSREGGSRGGGGGLQGRQRRERAGQVCFECSNASDGRTGHRCRRSLRISTLPCRSWPRGPFARTVHRGAPSRRGRAAIPLGTTLRRWYRRRMAPRDQNSPSAVLAADGGAAIAAGG